MIFEKRIIKNMKSICLIDNYSQNLSTDRIDRTVKIIQGNFSNIDLQTVHYSKLDLNKLKNFSGYILSGSDINVSEFSTKTKNRKDFKVEIELIRRTIQKPILAICYGHQLTAYAFGGEVQRMSGPSMGSGIVSLTLDKVDEIIPYDEILVNVHHQDYVIPEDANIRKEFEIISIKERNGYNTIQYMRHFKRPIFSVQFHPETHHLSSKYADNYDEQKLNKTKRYGEEIIKNFVSYCIQ